MGHLFRRRLKSPKFVFWIGLLFSVIMAAALSFIDNGLLLPGSRICAELALFTDF